MGGRTRDAVRGVRTGKWELRRDKTGTGPIQFARAPLKGLSRPR